MDTGYITVTSGGSCEWETTCTATDVPVDYSQSHICDCDGLCYDCEEGSYCWASECNETDNI